MKRSALVLCLLFSLAAAASAAAADKNSLPFLSLLLSGSAANEYTLTVQLTGDGSGTVTRNPDKSVYQPGDVVELTAVADEGSTFVGWSGDTCTGTGRCTLTMERDMTVNALFSKNGSGVKYYLLTVNKSGTGSGTVSSSPAGINCPFDCTEFYSEGTEVRLTAHAGVNSSFNGWSGSCSGSGACVVTMNGNLTVNAIFSELGGGSSESWLTVSVQGDGTVTSDDCNYQCGKEGDICSHKYANGTTVTLNAQPVSPLINFDHWEGAGAGCTTDPACTITVSTDQVITAVFGELTEYPETEGSEGNDDAAHANSGALDAKMTGVLDASGDQDWFYLSNSVERTLTVRMHVVQPIDDTYYRVQVWKDENPIDHQINQVDVAPNDSFNLTLPPGNFYFVVLGVPEHVDINGNYELTLFSNDGVTADPAESPEWPTDSANNDADHADTLALTSPMHGSLMNRDDEDWFKLDVSEAMTATVSFATIDREVDKSLYTIGDWSVTVYESDKTTQLARVEVHGGSTFHVKLPAGGTYYFQVQQDVGLPGDDYNGGYYRLEIDTYNGTAVAEIESNDVPADATTVDFSSGAAEMTGQLKSDTDVDWFTFTATTTGTIQVEVAGAVSGTHWRIFIYKDGALDTPVNEGEWFPTYGPTTDGYPITIDVTTHGTGDYLIKMVFEQPNVTYTSAEYSVTLD